MPRRVNVKASFLGGDVSDINIYHTTASAGYLLASNVTTSSLLSGVNVDAPDSASVFLARVVGGVCALATGSVIVRNNEPTLRFFDLIIRDQDGAHEDPANGTFEASTGKAAITVGATPPSSSLSVDYADINLLTLTATPTYPNVFHGWYTGSSNGSLLSTNATLSIGQNDYTGSNSYKRDTIIARMGS